MVINMNKIKMLIVAFCIISVCSGCSVKYDLQVRDDSINENISFSDYKINYNNDLFISPFESYSQKYSYSGFSTSRNGYYLTKQFSDMNLYVENSAIFDLFGNYDFVSVSGKNVKVEFNFNELKKDIINNLGKIDSLEVDIYVPYFVSKNNADSVSGNTYTWIIDDFENDKIIINFDMGKSTKFISNLILCILIVILAISIIVVIKYLIGRHNEANKI